jgi:hypothetical protein
LAGAGSAMATRVSAGCSAATGTDSGHDRGRLTIGSVAGNAEPTSASGQGQGDLLGEGAHIRVRGLRVRNGVGGTLEWPGATAGDRG